MKNAVFWDVTPCGSCKNIVFLCSVRRLLITANVGPSSQILVTLMMEVLDSSETSVITRATRRKIPEDGIQQSISLLEEWCLLGCGAVWVLFETTFPSSG
jgi:hypothetical protein